MLLHTLYYGITKKSQNVELKIIFDNLCESATLIKALVSVSNSYYRVSFYRLLGLAFAAPYLVHPQS